MMSIEEIKKVLNITDDQIFMLIKVNGGNVPLVMNGLEALADVKIKEGK